MTRCASSGCECTYPGPWLWCPCCLWHPDRRPWQTVQLPAFSDVPLDEREAELAAQLRWVVSLGGKVHVLTSDRGTDDGDALGQVQAHTRLKDRDGMSVMRTSSRVRVGGGVPSRGPAPVPTWAGPHINIRRS